MSITALSSSYGLGYMVTQLRVEMNDLQRQLGSGYKSQTYGGLGAARNVSLAAHSQLASLDGYQNTANTALLRLEVMQLALTRIGENIRDSNDEIRASVFELNPDGQTLAQTTARDRLGEVIQLLNTDINGRHLFAGRNSQDMPVESVSAILEGSGGKAGLKQLISERSQADLGADGRGRLVLPAAAGGVVSVAEDGVHPFGMKLNAVNNGLSGTVVAGPAGSPASLSVTFSATLPSAGEQIEIELNLPDGSTKSVILKATSSGTPQAGEFQIGVDAATTASNFQAALVNSMETFAQSELKAASAMQASDEFFDLSSTTVPQRVDGPPFDSAVALIDATTSDTVFWYSGDMEGNPRDGALAKLDESYMISYGARADEDALKDAVRYLAVMASETFSVSNPNDVMRYEALKNSVTDGMSIKAGEQSVASLQASLGYKQNTIKSIDDRILYEINFTLDMLSDAELVDEYEVGARLLELQVQLQASYQTTANLAKLTLVNFI